ncbi:hypothetical protein [Bacterioplanoides sp.]|uniref:hypothetical protein n=1 Tax=Bacterioplanoides sp. TaxID=2066072 RepID=UPI003AFFA94B
MKKLLLLSCISLLTACGGGSSDSSSSDLLFPTPNIAAFAGIYEDFSNEGELIDESYLHIDSDGYLSFYDYAGDAVDDFANCYWIEEKQFQIIEYLGDGSYKFRDSDNSEIVYGLSVSSEKLVITASNGRFDLPRTALTVSDLTPEC